MSLPGLLFVGSDRIVTVLNIRNQARLPFSRTEGVSQLLSLPAVIMRHGLQYRLASVQAKILTILTWLTDTVRAPMCAVGG